MQDFSIIQQICIWALPVLFAITLHEAAHAYVANYLGDSTAKMLGRMSLNPIRHIDPIGTIVMPLVIGFITNFSMVLGYAKPVPINWHHLKKPRRDMILVALAGPAMNFIMAFLWAGGYKIATLMHPESNTLGLFLLFSSRAGMLINLVLAFLNLIPIPPLDGGRIVAGLLPPRLSIPYSKLEPYGIFIVIILIFTNVLEYILTPLINLSLDLLSVIYSL